MHDFSMYIAIIIEKVESLNIVEFLISIGRFECVAFWKHLTNSDWRIILFSIYLTQLTQNICKSIGSLFVAYCIVHVLFVKNNHKLTQVNYVAIKEVIVKQKKKKNGRNYEKNCKLPKDQSYPLGNKLNNSLWYARHGVYFLVREHYMVMYHILIFFFIK